MQSKNRLLRSEYSCLVRHLSPGDNLSPGRFLAPVHRNASATGSAVQVFQIPVVPCWGEEQGRRLALCQWRIEPQAIPAERNAAFLIRVQTCGMFLMLFTHPHRSPSASKSAQRGQLRRCLVPGSISHRDNNLPSLWRSVLADGCAHCSGHGGTGPRSEHGFLSNDCPTESGLV